MLSSCQREDAEPAQRIELAEAQPTPRPTAPEVMAESPDTSAAAWVVSEDGHAIDFGNEGEAPLMSLACRLEENPPRLAIIRHAAARPGLSALFPVIGNGMRSRFLVDTVLEDNEWRWEGVVDADDPMLDVFTGPRALTATLPGRGMLEISGSRIPGEFIDWCRESGRVQDAVDAEAEDATAEGAVSE